MNNSRNSRSLLGIHLSIIGVLLAVFACYAEIRESRNCLQRIEKLLQENQKSSGLILRETGEDANVIGVSTDAGFTRVNTPLIWDGKSLAVAAACRLIHPIPDREVFSFWKAVSTVKTYSTTTLVNQSWPVKQTHQSQAILAYSETSGFTAEQNKTDAASPAVKATRRTLRRHSRLLNPGQVRPLTPSRVPSFNALLTDVATCFWKWREAVSLRDTDKGGVVPACENAQVEFYA